MSSPFGRRSRGFHTGADFAKAFVQNFSPALDMINSGVKDQFKELFGGKKQELPAPTDPTPGNDETQQINENFEDVK